MNASTDVGSFACQPTLHSPFSHNVNFLTPRGDLYATSTQILMQRAKPENNIPILLDQASPHPKETPKKSFPATYPKSF
jgi:hypothetical protein